MRAPEGYLFRKLTHKELAYVAGKSPRLCEYFEVKGKRIPVEVCMAREIIAARKAMRRAK